MITICYDALEKLHILERGRHIPLHVYLHALLAEKDMTIFEIERETGMTHPRGYNLLKGKSDSLITAIRILHHIGIETKVEPYVLAPARMGAQ